MPDHMPHGVRDNIQLIIRMEEEQSRERSLSDRIGDAIGTFAGSRLPAEAATLAGFVLAGNTLLRPLVNWVNRRPITPDVTEAKYAVHVTCRPGDVSDVRDLLDAELDRASYPVREVKTLSETDAQVELAAVLVPMTAVEAELDAVATALENSPLVLSATWSVEATS